MDCISESQLLELFDDRMTPAAREAIDAHIDDCARCRGLVVEAARGFPTLASPNPAEASTGPAAPRDDRPPGSGVTIAERYVLLDVVGMGGMGIVYVAYDRKLDRKVALKLLRPDVVAVGEARARLLREAQFVARLAHPNIINVHDVGEVDGHIYIDMEFVEGCTLREWLTAQARPVPEVVRAFLDAARGLAAAHAAGVIHRDFKPDNVLIGVDGRVRVNDFGLARTTAHPELPSVSAIGLPRPGRGEFETRTDVQVGTPAYMAPEQRRGEPATAAADQYAFCVALHEALSGERPTAAGRHDRVRDARIAEVLRRGLALDPQDRFPSMEALSAALSQATRRRRWPAFVAAGAAAVALGLGVASSRDEANACLDAPQYLAGVWDAARKEAVRQAFVATGVPEAGANFTAVARSIDRFADAWSAAHQEACEATLVRGEQSPELLERRMACLRRSLGEASSTLAVLAEADKTTVERAVDVVAGVTDPQRCSAAEVLQSATPVPPPALRERVEAHHARVARALALGYAGRQKEATALAQETVHEAAALGFPASEQEATHALGRAQMLGNAFAAAKDSFERALVLAEASGLDDKAVDALTTLTWSAASRAQYDEAEQWIRFAEAKLSRLGASGANVLSRRARLRHWQGEVQNARGRLDEAEVAHREALELRRRDPHGDPSEIGTSLNALGNLAQLRRDYAAAMKYYREGLALRERELGPDHPRVAGSLNNIGRMLVAECAWDDARRHFERALSIRRRLYGEDHVEIGRVLYNLADLEDELGRREQAIEAAERACAMTTRALGEEHPLLGAMWSSLSHLWLAEGAAAEALLLAERARALIMRHKGSEHADTAGSTHAAGRALLALGRVDESVALLERAWAIYAAGPEVELSRARAAHSLAQALWARGDHERAREAAGWAQAAMPACHQDEARRIAAWSAGLAADASP